MTRHLSNAAYGALDYVAYPVIMLIATPSMMQHLGVAHYGIWLIANAAISAGTLVSAGFGDAVIQRVSILRSTGEYGAIGRVVANMLAINLFLSCALALSLFVLVPFATGRITHYEPALITSCSWSLRIGSALIILKSVENVFISAQRAFQQYAAAVRISIATRISIIAISVLLAIRGNGLVLIMAATALLVALGTIAQWNALRQLGVATVMPAIDRSIFMELVSFGGFSWLQAISGMFFSQADRLLLALTLGASAVSYYSVCVQMAQPIRGLTAAGLHFIFPYLSARWASGNVGAIRKPVLYALAINVGCATIFSLAFVLFGKLVLEHWMGRSFASQSSGMIPLLALGFGMLALNITPHYALLAVGRVRVVTAFNIAGGVAMLAAMELLVRHRGVNGAAIARLFYGPVTCLLYWPLLQMLNGPSQRSIRLLQVATEEA